MVKLEDVRIWVSPLTKKVYIGTIGTGRVVEGLFHANRKVEITNEFIDTMIRFLQEHAGEVVITEQNTQKQYRIKLEEG